LPGKRLAVVEVVGGIQLQREPDGLLAHRDLREAGALLRLRSFAAAGRTRAVRARRRVGRGAPAREGLRVELEGEQDRRDAQAVFDESAFEQLVRTQREI